MIDLPHLAVSGTPRVMGQQQGEHFKSLIEAFVDVRFNALDGYLADRNTKDVGLFDIGAQCMQIHENWDANGVLEHRGIAEAAGIDPVRLYIATNMTDIRDILVLPSTPDAEGCSSVLLPGGLSNDGFPISGQTWDLNPTDIEYVVAISRRPRKGLATWTVSCAGCLSLVGMNEKGLSVGTTNIKTRGSKPGIGYLGLIHRLLQARSARAASHVVAQAPRSGAHVYWMADQTDLFEFETSPNHYMIRDAGEAPVCHTNHCLDPKHQALEGEVASDSSKARLARMKTALAGGKHDAASIKTLFANRDDGLHSINRYIEDEQGTATNSVFISQPHKQIAYACRGPADRGQWYRLDFDSDTPTPVSL